MPHAALWVVQLGIAADRTEQLLRFNAARGFVGGATCLEVSDTVAEIIVSMPHAALWVVQLGRMGIKWKRLVSFNAARGFVGGATV